MTSFTQTFFIKTAHLLRRYFFLIFIFLFIPIRVQAQDLSLASLKILLKTYNAIIFRERPLKFQLPSETFEINSQSKLGLAQETGETLNELKQQTATTKDKSHLLKLYDTKKEFYKARGEFDQALMYADKYNELNEELHELYQTQIREELKIKLDIHQKEKDNNILRNKTELNAFKIKNQRYLIWGVCTSAFTLLVLLILMMRLYYSKEKANRSLKEKQQVLNTSNENLERINAQKNNLFSIVAHDVKSPVSTLVQSTKMLKENSADFSKEELEQLAVQLNLSATGLYGLLEGVLTWAKSQMDGYKFTSVEIALKPFLGTLAATEGAAAHTKKISLKNEIKEDIGVFSDKQVLEVILRNFLTNAIKFTSPGGSIRLAAEKQDTGTLISVIDSGIGLTQEKINQLFVAKERYTRRGTADESGNGIGLILCDEIAQAMGAEIRVSSVVDAGSTFSLYIPDRKN